MRRGRSLCVFCARGQRRAGTQLRAYERCDETSHSTGMYTLKAIVSRFRYMLFSLGLVLLVIALIIGIALRNTTPSSNPEEMLFMAKSGAAMTRMMAAMKIRPSNNVDKDFVAMMLPHHQGAIDMAKAELSYGHNEPLRGLAQEIIATQQQEIVAMQLNERRLPPPSGPSPL
jgi:hypothetical protein